METVNFTYLTVAFIIFLTVTRGVKLVPQQQAWVVERLGRFQLTLTAGLNFIVPFIDSIAYKHSFKRRCVLTSPVRQPLQWTTSLLLLTEFYI